jgi:HK97 family phage portal protein
LIDVPGLVRSLAGRVLPAQMRTIQTLPWVAAGYGPATRPADLSAVMHASRLIVEPLSTMDWVQRDHRSGRRFPPPRWVSEPHMLRPDGRVQVGDSLAAPLRKSSVEFWSEWIADALLNGAGYFICMVGASGEPVAGTLRAVPSHLVQTVGPPGGVGWSVASVMGEQRFDQDGRLATMPNMRMVMLRGEPPYDPYTGRGEGVLQRAAADLELHGRIQRYSSGVYRSGVPSGYLKHSGAVDLTQKEADALRLAWDNAHASADTRATAILSAALDYQVIGVSPEDMAVIESKRLSLLDVALAFGVPPYKLGVPVGSMTYSSVEMETQNLVTETLAPKAARVEAVLSPLLPYGRDIDIDFRSMLRGDSAARVAYYRGMVDMGAMTPEMVAQAEGFDPLLLEDVGPGVEVASDGSAQ